ncbi:myocyte enhancer factor [Entomophthora muscae]|uniref:Myocyte enhancer factor n=1 Tax=Entomophthora muscae TaxID=34485 RepID=A0ACC2SM11_9FUNG|nr:myocyte enhancer factor [Entomophthora muscae]
MKKAYELSVLCECEIAVIVFNSSNKLCQFASSDMDKILMRYTEYGEPFESKSNSDFISGNLDKEGSEEQLSMSHTPDVHSAVDHQMYNQNHYQSLSEMPQQYDYLHPSMAYGNQQYSYMNAMPSPSANNFKIQGSISPKPTGSFTPQIPNQNVTHLPSNIPPQMGSVNGNMGNFHHNASNYKLEHGQNSNLNQADHGQSGYQASNVPQISSYYYPQSMAPSSSEESRNHSSPYFHASSQNEAPQESKSRENYQPATPHSSFSNAYAPQIVDEPNKVIDSPGVFKRPSGLRVQIPAGKAQKVKALSQTSSRKSKTEIESTHASYTANHQSQSPAPNSDPSQHSNAPSRPQVAPRKSISELEKNTSLQASSTQSPSTFYPNFYQSGELLSPLVLQTPQTANSGGGNAFNWPASRVGLSNPKPGLER